MRDLLLIGFFVVMLGLAFRRPFIALSVWFWTGMFAPHFLVYGFARSIRYNMIAAGVAILSYIIVPNKQRIALRGVFLLVSLFFFWTTVSSMFPEAPSYNVWQEWNKFFKVFVFFVFLVLIVHKKLHVDTLCYAVVLSLGFYSFVEGLKFIASGGGHRIFGPDNTSIKDNNHLALAVNMMLPIAFYLWTNARQKLVKYTLLFFCVVSFVAVMGTFSRGGAIGLAILFLFAIANSKKKLVLSVAFVAVSVVAVIYAPESWKGRMSTIDEAEQDSSFIGRVVAWKQSVVIALDNPLTGGGFHAVQTYEVWQKYASDFDKLDFIDTPHAYDYNFKAAHSIHFREPYRGRS